ncbi:polyprenyl synthetase family protein [Roseivivax isoporae]|uniref:Geranylgeranyl diphosphate synthase n=1 Tax=Roseivivax isoporae LMG 25204 TaxID=1449351 RepID=X7F5I8_9RHOB|nr:polyprenyl synthetase family protein [Roseivivax isoporae]ETX27988.1 farnesyl-diphosphate synthase [Roseivivax isoporae LMG 25204]
MAFEAGRAAAEAAIEAGLAARLKDAPDLPLTRAMAYALSGGKRLRGYLAMESARMHGIGDALAPALAIEAVHAYSLVHDDLPAMDDDATRRGQPTVHVTWDEATAILAGDALQTLGFEILLDPACHPDADVRADLALSLARAAGANGMVLGQALDIAAETATAPLALDDVMRLQAAKTGALIRWSAEAGARLARADLAPMTAYATALGLAFQIADDVLDVEGDAAAMGKAVGKDAAAGKATFVSLLGIDEAKRRAATLVEEACDALSPFGDEARGLIGAARFVIDRRS